MAPRAGAQEVVVALVAAPALDGEDRIGAVHQETEVRIQVVVGSVEPDHRQAVDQGVGRVQGLIGTRALRGVAAVQALVVPRADQVAAVLGDRGQIGSVQPDRAAGDGRSRNQIDHVQHLHRAGLDQRVAGVGIGGRQVQRAGADLDQVARRAAADDAAEGQRIARPDDVDRGAGGHGDRARQDIVAAEVLQGPDGRQRPARVRIVSHAAHRHGLGRADVALEGERRAVGHERGT